MNTVNIPELETEDAQTETEPRYTRLREWERLTGLGQRTTQDLIGVGELKAIKVGRATLIDYRHGLRWLSKRPPAQMKPQTRPARRKPAA